MPEISELTKQRVLASMKEERDKASRASWPYHPCTTICFDFKQHNSDAARYAEQRRENYLATCDRRIERYEKTGEIGG